MVSGGWAVCWEAGLGLRLREPEERVVWEGQVLGLVRRSGRTRSSSLGTDGADCGLWPVVSTLTLDEEVKEVKKHQTQFLQNCG